LHEQKRNESFVFLLFPAKIRLKRALNRYKNSLISKPNKKIPKLGKSASFQCLGAAIRFPFGCIPLPYSAPLGSGLGCIWLHSDRLPATKRPVIKGSKKKSYNKKRRHHDKRLPLRGQFFYSSGIIVSIIVGIL
jgi:hypothetical protein